MAFRKTTNRKLQKNFQSIKKKVYIQTILLTILILWIVNVYFFFHVDSHDIVPSQNIEYTHWNLSNARSNKVKEFLDFERNQYLTAKYKNPSIMKFNCSVTILLMDPALGNHRMRKKSLFYSLESTVSNIHPSAKETACILLQTSHCTNSDGAKGAHNHIWTYAQPELKKMIKSGNVRVTFLDHEKYKVKSCTNFYDPSRAWTNVHYWKEEFISEDSDLVLSIQHDSVLCHTFNPNLWRDVAWVGGVWPPRANMHNNPVPAEGMCHFLPKIWKQWSNTDSNEDHSRLSKLCIPKTGEGPFGNGGLTIRSRKWLIKAIHFCPSVRNSGLTISEVKNASCFIPLNREVAEDVFYSTILRVMGAPLPTVFEASLFSVEMIFAEHVLKYYYDEVTDEVEKELETMVVRRWGNDTENSGLELFRKMRKQKYTIPIGFHKPYLYQPYKDLGSPYIKNECPFLDHIIPPRKRYEVKQAFNPL